MLVATYAERPDLAARIGEFEDVWPEFIHHATANRHWPRLREEFPDFQLVLYDEEEDTLLGRGQTVRSGARSFPPACRTASKGSSIACSTRAARRRPSRHSSPSSGLRSRATV
jgi:hypothetical protein